MPFHILLAASLAYVAFLFAVAFMVERRAEEGAAGWLRSPLVYTLSLSVYCTAWTFYGAVGYAARSGLEFLTIYLGPTLVFVGWWWVLRKLVRIGRQARVTSIADLISARYGKSNILGVIVTVLCVVAATPYIALQLQSISLSFGVFVQGAPEGFEAQGTSTAIWVAAGLALFAILFGTRNLDADERHPGIVTAIAVEAVVKLVALLAVGIFVVWGLAGGVGDVLARIDGSAIAGWDLQPSRWAGLIFTSAAAVICLPRMFQVMVVENPGERHLATASWAFPLYLMLMSLFVVPIAVMGLDRLPPGANPDLFVLTLPLAEGQGALAMLAFLGGFSSATSMVIVEALALATMVSNHVVMPLWLRLWPERAVSGAVSGDVRRIVILSRRLSIAGVLALGYAYFRLSGGSTALASIGLIAFVGVAQILPALIGGIFWRGATRAGAATGLTLGFAVWAWTLFLPSFGPDAVIAADVQAVGPWGLGWLRPGALFGLGGLDPLIHALFWSLALNAAGFALVSIVTFPGPVERVQGAAFVNVFDEAPGPDGWARGLAEPEALLVTAQRILGDEAAQALFEAEARAQGKEGMLPDPTPGFVAGLERRLAGSVGSATAHAMISQIAGRAAVTVEDLMAVASEAAQIMEYSARLEAREAELTRTARALREANAKLTALGVQKDAFLSQISHELRTPMTSIRAFSEILMEAGAAGGDATGGSTGASGTGGSGTVGGSAGGSGTGGGMPAAQAARYAGVIHDEAIRLTRLLDDLLDLSVLESGTVQLHVGLTSLREVIDRALVAAGPARDSRPLAVVRDLEAEEIHLLTDGDRLAQVFINLISNARKYCDAGAPELRIAVRHRAGRVTVDFIDNGRGIPQGKQALIFEKFARLTDQMRAGGAGLGLAICREVMLNLGGTVSYLPGQGGAAFRVTLPLRLERAA